MKYILLLPLIIILIYLSLIYYRNNYILHKIIRHYKPLHERLLIMLPLVVELFNKYQVTYFLSYGNLLGYKRHNKNFIPWDDDIDLAIINTEDLDQKMWLIDSDLKKIGMKISVRPFGYAVDNIDHSIPANKAYIDLFVIYNNVDGTYKGNSYTQKTFPNEWYYSDDIFPLQTEFFCNMKLNFPNNIDNILKRLYGDNCLQEYRISHIHHGSTLDKYIVKYTSRISIKV